LRFGAAVAFRLRPQSGAFQPFIVANLKVPENVIAKNVTELETQFLVSEILERIPSLRAAAKRGEESG
jgi:hypothetical protein